MKRLEDVIRRPLVTEKSTILSRANNQYVFAVDLKANKQEIREAVSTLFNVKVVDVNTSIIPGEPKRRGRIMTRTTKWKKAVVTLADGQKIDLFDRVEDAADAAQA